MFTNREGARYNRGDLGWFFEEKGGYQRINTPTHKGKQTTTDKEVDWRYRISNDKSREIINTLPIRTFCQRHHIKYLGHICRLGNRAMQKQLLFDTRTQDKVSKKNGKTSRCGQGSSEKRYDDKNRSDATGGCKSKPTRSAPRPDTCPAGNTMMMMIHRGTTQLC